MVEKKNKNSKYNYSIIVGTATLLGVILVSLLVVKPLYTSAKKLTADATQKQENLNKLKDKKAKLEELKEREAELKEDSAKVAAALPEGKDAGRLFIQFDELVKAAGGSVKSVSQGSDSSATTTTAATGDVNKITYTIPVNLPSYFNFKDLLAKTEGALRLVNIDNLNVRSTNGQIDTNLSIVTFTRK